ncbi:MAG: helix-turn-helix domain-containing protein [Prevotella sp.]|nr:helix-turn-helix domain-containing protein [Prevotella sp.]
MAKYNIVEKKEKTAAYRNMVSAQVMDDLEERIHHLIYTQKRFRDKKYSAKRLAEDLGTNTRYISAVVNVKFHMNYTSFVNSFRVNEAMNMLTDSRYLKMNMEDISDAVGFANRQSFYAAFYKMTGKTPRDYRQEFLRRHPEVLEAAKEKEKKEKRLAAKKARAKAREKAKEEKAKAKAKAKEKATKKKDA